MLLSICVVINDETEIIWKNFIYKIENEMNK